MHGDNDDNVCLIMIMIVLMIYEINYIWTAEMKWKWRNDRRGERNLCNCVKKPEKKNQDFNGVWTPDLAITGAMLYQLAPCFNRC